MSAEHTVQDGWVDCRRTCGNLAAASCEDVRAGYKPKEAAFDGVSFFLHFLNSRIFIFVGAACKSTNVLSQ
jgi:hypothetical protein